MLSQHKTLRLTYRRSFIQQWLVSRVKLEKPHRGRVHFNTHPTDIPKPEPFASLTWCVAQHHSPFWVNGTLNIKHMSRDWWATHSPAWKEDQWWIRWKRLFPLSSLHPSLHPFPLHSSIWDVLCEIRQTKEAGCWPPSLIRPFLSGTNGSLSLCPLAEGLALLTNGPVWLCICYAFSTKTVSWVAVFQSRMLIYASFLPTIILGGAHVMRNVQGRNKYQHCKRLWWSWRC